MNRDRLLFELLVLSFLLPIGAGCGERESTGSLADGQRNNAKAPLVRVTPIQPVRKDLVRWTEQSGQIEPFEETPLYAKVAGYVEKVHADIGEAVKGPEFDTNGKPFREGQLLVELSIPELAEELQQKQAAIGQAKSEIEQARAAVKVARAAEVSARARLDEAQALVEQSQADYDFAHSEFVRLKKLAERGSVTREIADEKEKLFRSADSARKQAQARISSTKATISEKEAEVEKSNADVEAARKKLEVADADLAYVKALLAYTKIRAPYDGVVTARNVHTGHLVQPGTVSGSKPLLVVVSTRVMRIFVDIPEIDAPLLSDGTEAEVTVPAAPSEVRKGTVARSSWTLESKSRTLRAEVDLPNDDRQLRPGMYATARIKLAERKDALSLPQSAILTEDKKHYCLTIDEGGRISRTPVELGIRAGDEVEIVSGLSGDEQVVGVNVSAFRPGQEVEVAGSK